MSALSQNRVDYLRGVSFFRDLSPGSLDLVTRRMVHRFVPAGSILFQKGESARGVYVLVKGRVEIYRSTADGREQVIHTETPVQSVAELPVFDGGDYSASGRTADDCDLVFLSLQDFQRLYREHPEISDAVIGNLGSRLRALVKVVERTSLRTVPERVASTLLDFAETAGALRDGGVFTLPRIHVEVASEVATSRESVSRAMGDLRKRGIISNRGREVRILSCRGLEETARGEEDGGV
jgi:CRP/FNR family transcriptional regulator